jgi:hypothetical protein
VSEQSAAKIERVSFRVPRTAYLVILFLVAGVSPVALYGGPESQQNATISPLTLLYLVPVLAALFIARTATIVDARGITVRAVFGQRTLPWEQLRGLAVSGRSVYAVSTGGSVRLPCVRQRNLNAVAAASGGRLPELPAEPAKYAPSGRRR